ncbi:MAG: RsmE family RNA methyltransferase [Verrucomicrobiota bacterium]
MPGSNLEGVNLVLITADEAQNGLSPDDPRARHLRETVGLGLGGTFHVGIEDGLRGIATIAALAPSLTFTVAWEKSAQARLPLTVLVGLPRPQTAKKVLHDLASLGAARLVFFGSAKGDPGYLTSSLWKDGEWREHVLKGTEQACSTLVPEVTRVGSLAEAVALLAGDAWKLALDPYEATGAPELSAPATSAVLAIGPERGFADAERATLRDAGFGFAHLGDRILRVEAAALVGGALMLAQLRAWEKHRPLGG